MATVKRAGREILYDTITTQRDLAVENQPLVGARSRSSTTTRAPITRRPYPVAPTQWALAIDPAGY